MSEMTTLQNHCKALVEGPPILEKFFYKINGLVLNNPSLEAIMPGNYRINEQVKMNWEVFSDISDPMNETKTKVSSYVVGLLIWKPISETSLMISTFYNVMETPVRSGIEIWIALNKIQRSIGGKYIFDDDGWKHNYEHTMEHERRPFADVNAEICAELVLELAKKITVYDQS